jgi:hypothetical protein
MCQWVSEPINTYSNLSYILISIFLFWVVLKKKNSDLNLMPKLLLGIGIASSIYHASNNYMGQVLDFLFIFLFLFWPLTLNMKKLGKITEQNQYYFYGAITSAFLTMMHIMYLTFIPFQFLAAVAGAILCFSEWKCSKIPGNKDTYTFFILAILIIAVGEVFSFLDLKRIVCTPSNHLFQGHALWHIISAIGLGFLIIHMCIILPSNTQESNEEEYDDDDDTSSFSSNVVTNMNEDSGIEYYDEEIEEDKTEESKIEDETVIDFDHQTKDSQEATSIQSINDEEVIQPLDTNNDTESIASDEDLNDENQLELSFDSQTHDDPIIDTYANPESTDDNEEVHELSDDEKDQKPE